MKKFLKMTSMAVAVYLVTGGILGCSGQKFSMPSQDNVFSQTPQFNNKVDILFMSDDSSNMLKYQNSLAAQMDSMVATLDGMGMDYQVAVTSSSMGSGYTGGKFIGSPKILAKGNGSFSALLKAKLKVGQAGSDLEQGLSSLQSSLSPNYLAGEGKGFLRSDALLAIIVLSNEDDYSAGSTASFVNYVDSLKQPFSNGVRSWVLNFLGIVSLDPSCPSQSGPVSEYIEVGTRYMDIAHATGGVTESICTSNWAQIVTNVRVRINQILSDFYLARKPLLSSIKVSVDGKAISKDATNGWSYEEQIVNGVTKYFIRFHGTSVPSFYQKIVVSFDPESPT